MRGAVESWSDAGTSSPPSLQNSITPLRFMSDILNKTIVLVLNRNWQAIHVRTPQEAFCMMATNVATALEIEGDEHIRPAGIQRRGKRYCQQSHARSVSDIAKEIPAVNKGEAAIGSAVGLNGRLRIYYYGTLSPTKRPVHLRQFENVQGLLRAKGGCGQAAGE